MVFRLGCGIEAGMIAWLSLFLRWMGIFGVAIHVLLAEETLLEEPISDAQKELNVVQNLYQQMTLLRAELDPKSDDFEAKKLQLAESQAEFEKILVGEEAYALYAGPPKEVTLEDEVMQILQPFFGVVKETTASLREKEDLRLSIESLKRKKSRTQEALERIRAFEAPSSTAQTNIDLRLLTSFEMIYLNRLKLVEAQLSVQEDKLEEIIQREINPVEELSRQVSVFLRSTGIHLTVAVMLSLSLFFGINFSFKKLLTYSQEKAFKSRKWNYEHLATAHGTVFLGSITAAVCILPMTFLAFNNWFLMGAFALILFSFLWICLLYTSPSPRDA